MARRLTPAVRPFVVCANGLQSSARRIVVVLTATLARSPAPVEAIGASAGVTDDGLRLSASAMI